MEWKEALSSAEFEKTIRNRERSCRSGLKSSFVPLTLARRHALTAGAQRGITNLVVIVAIHQLTNSSKQVRSEASFDPRITLDRTAQSVSHTAHAHCASAGLIFLKIQTPARKSGVRSVSCACSMALLPPLLTHSVTLVTPYGAGSKRGTTQHSTAQHIRPDQTRRGIAAQHSTNARQGSTTQQQHIPNQFDSPQLNLQQQLGQSLLHPFILTQAWAVHVWLSTHHTVTSLFPPPPSSTVSEVVPISTFH